VLKTPEKNLSFSDGKESNMVAFRFCKLVTLFCTFLHTVGNQQKFLRAVCSAIFVKSFTACAIFALKRSFRFPPGTGVTVYSVHPGAVKTDLTRHVFSEQSSSVSRSLVRASQWPIFSWILKWKTPVHGAQTSIYCAIAPELEGITGKYYR